MYQRVKRYFCAIQSTVSQTWLNLEMTGCYAGASKAKDSEKTRAEAEIG
jgi:hypothetical protein